MRISPEALRKIPADFAKERRVLPIQIDEGVLRVATIEPGNHRMIDDIRLLSGLEVEEVAAPEQEIIELIAELYRVTVEQMIDSLVPRVEDGEAGNLHDIEVMANEPTVINLVNVIISTALKERASDIHIVPFEKELQLKYRIDGLLQDKPPPPKHLHAAPISRIKIMADMNIAERFLPQDGHIQIHHKTARVDIRVGTMPTIHKESAVLRLLEKGDRVKTTRELGLDEERATLLSQLVDKTHGLFLATGPTGSGKTTTLYSILAGAFTPEKKILTIEDPVEYELPGVAQIPVRPSRGFTFATGLRSILRQDPDVVMVGEIRDSETADTRNFRTDLLVKSGQTVILGGIIQEEDGDVIRKVPLLGDIPILGWAFKKKDKTTRKVELMVFLRPIISRTPEEAESLVEEIEKNTPKLKAWRQESEATKAEEREEAEERAAKQKAKDEKEAMKSQPRRIYWQKMTEEPKTVETIPVEATTQATGAAKPKTETPAPAKAEQNAPAPESN